MILFFNDWGKYPTATIHRTTRNKSFLHLAEKYRTMGVKNFEFILALVDQDLEFVDPHDPDISEVMAAKVERECLINPWYFFREVARVPPRGGSNPWPLDATRGNIMLLWCFFNHANVGLVQPRQTGKSLIVDLLMAWLLFIRCRHTTISTMTLSDKLRIENIARLKKIRLFLPVYLRMFHKDDLDNYQVVTCRQHTNVYTSGVSQSSASSALSTGRGLTSAIQQIDETAYIEHIQDVLAGMLPGGDAARDEAKRINAPYGVLYTTTAGQRDTETGKFVHSLFHTSYRWTEKLFDTPNWSELVKTVRAGGNRKFMIYGCFSHRQLGKTDEWLQQTMIDNNSYGERAERDYLNIWTAGGVRSPLTAELNQRIRDSQEEPAYTQITKYGYTLRWYVPEDEIEERMGANKIIFGMDTSEMLGGNRDNTSLVFVDSRTLEVIATAKVNETNTIRFTEWVASLMVEYENLILVPERKTNWGAVISQVVIQLASRGQDPFKRIYNRIVDNHTTRQREFDEIVQIPASRRPISYYDKHLGEFGFVTSGGGAHSRKALYGDALYRATSLGCDRIRDSDIIDELTSLEIKNGRMDHPEGQHDDMAVGWLLCAWFLLCSKNLGHYGINNALDKTKEFKSGGAKFEPVRDIYEEIEEERQQSIKTELEGLLDELRGERDEAVAERLERRIRARDGKLSTRLSDSNTLDDLIENARGERTRATNRRLNEHKRSTGRRWGGGDYRRGFATFDQASGRGYSR